MVTESATERKASGSLVVEGVGDPPPEEEMEELTVMGCSVLPRPREEAVRLDLPLEASRPGLEPLES